jgi:hypothetical protein
MFLPYIFCIICTPLAERKIVRNFIFTEKP